MELADWLTKEQVAERLEVSVKTVERLAKDGALQRKIRKQRPQPVAVYHPGDVERVYLEMHPSAVTAHVVPAAPAPMSAAADETEGALIPAALTPDSFAKLLGTAIAEALAAVKPSTEIFTPEEAAVYSKRSKNALRDLRKAGRLPNAGSAARVLYRRADLDKL